MKFRACNFLVIPIFAFSACSGQSESEPKAQSCVIETGTFANVIGGTAKLGSEQHYREERPLRKAEITSFNIDETEVTNGQFAAFVDATGYITDAEKPQPGYDVTGGAVFVEPTDENPSWWQFIDGANWRHPEGPDSSIKGRAFEPVVQVSLNDARAYAKWAGRRLPTESEWEYAANAGADTEFVWGDERAPNDKEMANSWQGTFPIENTLEDGYLFRAPVGCYDPNNFGLYDMIGNVWEWTETVYQDSAGEPIHVIKGGSFLCAPNYCRRYRSSARQPQEAGLPTNHIGFRTVGKISD
ncbi:MAG: formylglycine-generating enzyme family protein [Hellea sp.]|nr:formylglycine-generating enzyme family protein [Hellea sp.]